MTFALIYFALAHITACRVHSDMDYCFSTLRCGSRFLLLLPPFNVTRAGFSPLLLCYVKVGCVTAASYAGALVAFSVSPAIMHSTGGWESVFYAFGGGSLFLLPAWLLLPMGSTEGDAQRSRCIWRSVQCLVL